MRVHLASDVIRQIVQRGRDRSVITIRAGRIQDAPRDRPGWFRWLWPVLWDLRGWAQIVARTEFGEDGAALHTIVDWCAPAHWPACFDWELFCMLERGEMVLPWPWVSVCYVHEIHSWLIVRTDAPLWWLTAVRFWGSAQWRSLRAQVWYWLEPLRRRVPGRVRHWLRAWLLAR